MDKDTQRKVYIAERMLDYYNRGPHSDGVVESQFWQSLFRYFAAREEQYAAWRELFAADIKQWGEGKW